MDILKRKNRKMTWKSEITFRILHLIITGLFILYFVCFSNWGMEMMDPNCTVGCVILFGCTIMLWCGSILRDIELKNEINKLRSERNDQE